jgi:hypothetical protein
VLQEEKQLEQQRRIQGSALPTEAKVVNDQPEIGCEQVVAHIFSNEAKEMAPATFADPEARKEMMRACCKKF